MRVVVLGTAAGGGLPQWNCACELCARCRAGDADVPPRTQDCVAISATGREWYLLNASPDLRAQIVETAELAPGPGRRETPVRGVLLTDAELDHALGLALLREGPDIAVWAPKPVAGALADGFPVRDIVSRYHSWDWREATGEFTVDDGRLECAAFPLSGKRPRYAADAADAPDWVVAYRVRDAATGGTLVYAPCLADWPPGFDEFVDGADLLLVDGTFFTSGEMSRATGKDAGQGRMGHLPITESLHRLSGVGFRAYTHLNNTNPVADAASPERAEVAARGAHILDDGARFDL
ncbi:pyrroloquinoline quinone biosynthesis protein PqqB [Actinokineospora auranticolor]|uniref:Coenzyme PQQ synthesis protein B n=1 Tax=Actinokineospora auranticolor TaxID=155976 RepID=A0A2S6GPQ2_9PSEU|nr:pyrroloquinoline quinone biosynthesis protein PqqB [Actinokineospora auranticolor]PPK67204.1 pyrroloquinoline quinone biosynthesis protein B [Actinokineospora auranticolor]